MKRLLRRLFLWKLQFILEACPTCSGRPRLHDKPNRSWAVGCSCGMSWSCGPNFSASEMLREWTLYADRYRRRAEELEALRLRAIETNTAIVTASQRPLETDTEGDIDRDLRATGADRQQQYRARTDD